ncbi:MAG: hypothetical protein E7290_06445 [Lachnospiraceae bacterium]|nr:hypothetical protein [Lachnospiraceae bacterium]
MDNFIDKLASKFSAQEFIKANSQAEAAEMKRLQLQVAEYEKILQEIRKQNYKNAELTDKIESIIGENAGRIKDIQSDEVQMLATLRDLLDEQRKLREEELARLDEQKHFEEEQAEQTKLDIQAIEELIKNSNDFVHKENVKVYRNVQAVVTDELQTQTQHLESENKKLATKVNLAMIFAVLSLLGAVAGVVLQVLEMMGFQFF